MSKLDNLKRRLEKSGFQVKKIKAVGGCDVLFIDTDYEGPQPQRETFDKIADIRKICKRRFLVKPIAFYTAVEVKEM